MKPPEYPVDGSSALQPTLSPESPSRRMVSFAVLKANWNQGQTYLDNFVPFAGECLRSLAGPASVEELQGALYANFGIKMPQAAVKTTMGRVVEAGLAVRQDGRYRPVGENLSVLQRSRDVRDFERCYKALVQKLCDFAQWRYERSLPEEEAATALNQYVDEFGMPIVLRGTAAELTFPQDTAASPTAMYIVHAFVEELAAADPETFTYLEKIVEGAMLTSVVFLPDLGSTSRKFKDATAYLDTPFLLRALGYEGKEVAEPARELLALLKSQGVRVACFDHTRVEVRGVLNSAAKGLEGRTARGRGGVVSYFAQQGKRGADVFLLAAELEKHLRELGVEILPTPSDDKHAALDKPALERALNRGVRYVSSTTLDYDLKSLAAVHSIRKGQSQLILEHAKAIFVTTNTKLVDVVRKHFENDDRDLFAWPLAISDSNLATIVWLKEPMAAPELPRKQIMAECYAALRPDPVLWDRWLDEIDRTDPGKFTPEQLEIMRFSPDVQRALMDRTFGDPDAVSQPTVAEVLSQAEAKVREPLTQEVNELRDQLEHLQAFAHGQKERGDRSEARAQDAETAAEAATDALRSERERRTRAARQRAATLANWYSRLLYLAYAVIVAVVFVGASLFEAPGAARLAGAVIAAAGACGLHLGQVVTRVRAWLEEWLATRAVRRNGDDHPLAED